MSIVDKNLLAKFSEDRALASAALFSNRHPDETPAYHVEIIDLWRCRDELVLIEVYRGGAKTTLSEEFLCLEGCFGNIPYGLIILETYQKACERLEAIAKEAATNIKLHALFGGKVLARKPIENKVWFKSGCMLQAVGWEQELQSFKYLDSRPWAAYLDDVENLERVRNSESVDASEKKFWLELLPALDRKHRRIRITQTRRAEDCMVTRFAKNPEFVYRAYPVCNGDIDNPRTESLWPHRYPMDWIRAERDRYKGSGKLTDFLQAYMLQATNPETKPFKDEHIQSTDMAPWHWMPRHAIYDPARTSDPQKSDQYGKVVVSRDGSKILVHESSGSFWKPDEFIKDLFLTNEQHAPANIGIEKNSLDDWLMQPVRIAMLARGVALPLKPLQAPQDRNKHDFILGLQPFFAAKEIVLVGGRVAHAKLVAEILNFPFGTLNVLNALAYSLKMFSGLPIYEDFSHANIGEAPEPRPGETVYVCFNATPTETVAVAVVRERRSVFVAADFSASGPPLDAVKMIGEELRATFPRATFSVWVPQDVYDNVYRIPLVSALISNRMTPHRGEHTVLARGCMADRIRTVIRQRRLLMVDPKAKLTANALGGGYCLPVEKGGRNASEPEQGISRLVAEAAECLTFELDRAINLDEMKGANVAVNAQGMKYHTALPTRR